MTSVEMDAERRKRRAMGRVGFKRDFMVYRASENKIKEAACRE